MLISFLILLAAALAIGFRLVWWKAKQFEAALCQALHSAAVRFSLDSQ